MSKIFVSTNTPVNNNKFAYSIKKLTNSSLSSVLTALRAGKANFFYSCELFSNDHIQVSNDLRRIVQKANEHDIELFIVEILYNQQLSDFTDFKNVHISTQILLTILDEAEGQFM
ncbi:hypothetical protein APED_27890 [Acanthopleuribacter pedis]